MTTNHIAVRVYESDGSDGYSPGTWGYYVVESRDGCEIGHTGGGYASREHATECAEEVAS